MERTKPINTKPPPASPLHRNNQTPRIHRKNPPRLAPKIKYSRHVRRQFIETYRRETQTLPQALLKQKKELIRQGLTRPEGKNCVIVDTGENHWTCGPALITIDIQSPWSLPPSKALDTRHRGSTIPQLGVTEEGSDAQRG